MSTTTAPAAPLAPAVRKRGRRIAVAVLLVALVAAGGAFAVTKLHGGHNAPAFAGGPTSAPFKIARPNGWQSVAPAKLATLKGSPLAVLRRGDGKGLVVINARPKTATNLKGFSQQLDTQLAKRLPDFKRLSARTVTVRAGQAFLYTYLRSSKRTVNTVVVVPGKTRTYVLNAIVPTGARTAARQVGAMLASFDA
jgi:hypothetical protein